MAMFMTNLTFIFITNYLYYKRISFIYQISFMKKGLHLLTSFKPLKTIFSAFRLAKHTALVAAFLFLGFMATSQVMQRNPKVTIGQLIKVIPSLKDLKTEPITDWNRKNILAVYDMLEEAEEK